MITPKKTIKGILFDKDGTLFKQDGTWQAWYNRVLELIAPGHHTLQQQLGHAVGFNWLEQRFVPDSLSVSASFEEIYAVWEKLLPNLDFQTIETHGKNSLVDLPLNPACDLKDLCKTLNAMGYRVGCATNDYETTARTHLASADVLNQFDFIAGADSGYGAKPEPGMISAFAKHIGAKTEEIIMVGDSAHDLNAGQAAQTAYNIGVLTGPAEAVDLSPLADVVLKHIGEIPAWLAGNL